MEKGIKGLLSPGIRYIFCKSNIIESELVEIRLRIGKPLIMVSYDGEHILKEYGGDTRENNYSYDYIVKHEDIQATMELVSNYSLYAYEDEIRQGFITVRGGHRVGFAGQVILENGRIKSLKHISFINIRVSHEIKGCGNTVIPYIYKAGRVLNTLIVSPPGCGKTTLLRDMVRIISDGNSFGKGMNVGIVDERSELGACYMGKPQNDVGIRTDVLDSCPKAEGMLMLLRSMSPKVIAVDEIGSREDVDAISYVINCGCAIIATIHGYAIDDIRTRPILRRLVDEKVFDRYVVLGDSNGIGSIENIFDERGNELYMPLLSVAN